MSNLQKTYLSDGTERVYRIDENETEFFYYHDPRTNYTVRAATEDEHDIESLLRISDELDVEYLKKGVNLIDRSDNQEQDMWIIEDSHGNSVCAADVFYLKNGNVDVAYYFRNPVFKKLYEKDVKRTLCNLAKNEFRASLYIRIAINAVKPIFIYK